MDRPCVCIKSKPVGMAQVAAMQSTPSIGESKPPRVKVQITEETIIAESKIEIAQNASGDLVVSKAEQKEVSENVFKREPETKITEPVQPTKETMPTATTSEPVAATVTNPAQSQPVKKKGLKKTEVAFKLGRQMGYPDEVVEAIMCEREMDPQQWERKYAHIYLHPLATQLPPNYDPRKWIPGDNARDSFRDMVNQYLPNKPRKINFDEMCPDDLALET